MSLWDKRGAALYSPVLIRVTICQAEVMAIIKTLLLTALHPPPPLEARQALGCLH